MNQHLMCPPVPLPFVASRFSHITYCSKCITCTSEKEKKKKSQNWHLLKASDGLSNLNDASEQHE